MSPRRNSATPRVHGPGERFSLAQAAIDTGVDAAQCELLCFCTTANSLQPKPIVFVLLVPLSAMALHVLIPVYVCTQVK